jgi:hypothetical protein
MEESLAVSYNVTYPGLVILKHSDDKRVDYKNDLNNKYEIVGFITENQVPWFATYTDEAF